MGFRIDFLRGKLDENFAYGHHDTLANYCGVDSKDLRIFARYQHGIGTSHYFPDDRIKNLVWSDEIRNESFSRGLKNIVSIGAPILYLSNKEAREFWEELQQRKFTLCLAPHSTFDDQVDIFQSNDFLQYFPRFQGKDALLFYAKSCIEQSQFRPIVLLYHKDLTEQNRSKFLQLGIPVVTLGDGIFDGVNQATYLHKTVSILQKASEILVSNVSTLWLYAGYLDRPISFNHDSAFQAQLMRIASFFNAKSGDIGLFRKLVGEEVKREPSELLEIFQSDSTIAAFRARSDFIRNSAENLKIKLKKKVLNLDCNEL